MVRKIIADSLLAVVPLRVSLRCSTCLHAVPLLAPAAAPPRDGCIGSLTLCRTLSQCKAFLVAGGIVGRVLPLTRGALVCCGCIRPQATRAKHKERKFALTKTALDTPIKKGKASAPKVESVFVSVKLPSLYFARVACGLE